MDAYINNQTKELTLASVNGSYHRKNKQDPFLMAWLADFEALDAQHTQITQKQEVPSKPDSTYSC